MAWKATGRPTVRRQRDKWVVRVDGIDTTTGKERPRQLGTFGSRRSAQAAATSFASRGELGGARGTVGQLVEEWATSRLHVTAKARMQYEWAASHIKRDLGAIRVDQLDRDDVARWLDGLASGGQMSRRSIQIFRMVLRAALADAVEAGQLTRNPAARIGMPRHIVKPDRKPEVEAWTEDQVQQFLAAIDDHRWAAPIRLCVHLGATCQPGTHPGALIVHTPADAVLSPPTHPLCAGAHTTRRRHAGNHPNERRCRDYHATMRLAPPVRIGQTPYRFPAAARHVATSPAWLSAGPSASVVSGAVYFGPGCWFPLGGGARCCGGSRPLIGGRDGDATHDHIDDT